MVARAHGRSRTRSLTHTVAHAHARSLARRDGASRTRHDSRVGDRSFARGTAGVRKRLGLRAGCGGRRGGRVAERPESVPHAQSRYLPRRIGSSRAGSVPPAHVTTAARGTEGSREVPRVCASGCSVGGCSARLLGGRVAGVDAGGRVVDRAGSLPPAQDRFLPRRISSSRAGSVPPAHVTTAARRTGGSREPPPMRGSGCCAVGDRGVDAAVAHRPGAWRTGHNTKRGRAGVPVRHHGCARAADRWAGRGRVAGVDAAVELSSAQVHFLPRRFTSSRAGAVPPAQGQFLTHRVGTPRTRHNCGAKD